MHATHLMARGPFDVSTGAGRVRGTGERPERKSISHILRTAYHRHTRDTLTRQAVKRVLK